MVKYLILLLSCLFFINAFSKEATNSKNQNEIKKKARQESLRHLSETIKQRGIEINRKK